MRRNPLILMHVLILVLTSAMAIGPAFGEKPEWAGGKGKGQAKEKGPGGERVAHAERYFDDNHRTYVREYYGKEFHAGRCPPGLAKKHNGCMPPGQAKKMWQIGQPLPRDVVFYNLPPALTAQIGVPPPGYRFVRVASDILMIAIGTGMVVDAIQDLGRM